MKTFVFYILISIMNLELIAQQDSTFHLAINDSIIKEYRSRDVPLELKDSCNHYWKIQKSSWFNKRWHRGFSKKVGGNYSKLVLLAYSTNSFYIVHYLSIEGRSIEPRLLILNKEMKVLNIVRLFEPAESTQELIHAINDKHYY